MILRTCNRHRFCPLVLVLLAVFAGGMSGCSTVAPEKEPSSPPQQSAPDAVNGTTVPITLSDRQFIELSVKIGEQSHQFLLYPSLDQSILFSGKETDPSVEEEPAVETLPGSQRRVLLSSVRIGSNSFGSLGVVRMKRENVKSLSTVLAKESLSAYTGILGYNFLRNKELKVNYPERTLRLRTASVDMKRAALQVIRPGRTDFDLASTARNKRMIKFRAGVNGNFEGTFSVDLGIPVNLIDQSVLESWNLQKLSDTKLQQRFGASSSRFDFVSVSRLWISGQVFRNVLLRVREEMKLQLGVDAEVILGNYFFTDKVIQINFPQRWISIQPGDQPDSSGEE